jgi:hypothetical protein
MAAAISLRRSLRISKKTPQEIIPSVKVENKRSHSTLRDKTSIGNQNEQVKSNIKQKKQKIKKEPPTPSPTPLFEHFPEWFRKKPYFQIHTGQKLVGAHVSASPSVAHAVTNAKVIEAKSFALFLKNQRRWESKPLVGEVVERFKTDLKDQGFLSTSEGCHGCVLPHASYLINLGHPQAEKWNKSFEHFLEDLQRCEKLVRLALIVSVLKVVSHRSQGN